MLKTRLDFSCAFELRFLEAADLRLKLESYKQSAASASISLKRFSAQHVSIKIH